MNNQRVKAVRPNTALELTPLCGYKIIAILTAGIGSTAIPIYCCGAAQRQAVGRLGQRDRSFLFDRMNQSLMRMPVVPVPLCWCSLCRRGSIARSADCPLCSA
jgi:hypothetical protein